MRMQEFKEGKIAVYAETKEEATRFLKACEEEGLRWRSGQAPLAHRRQADTEFVYNYDGIRGLAAAWGAEGGANQGYHAKYTTDTDRPYKSVTVGEFFDEPERLVVAAVTDLSFEAFKQGKYAVTFQNPKRGDPEVEAFLKVCEAKGLSIQYMNVDDNIRPGIKADTCGLFGSHAHLVPEVPYASVPWAQSQKRERVTIYRTADGRVECVHTLDGKEVGKASVTRYYKDTDDFLTAAKFALGKLSAAEVAKGLPAAEVAKRLPAYKVGDCVKVRSDLKVGESYAGARVREEMLQYRGETFMLGKSRCGSKAHFCLIGAGNWCWTADMFEGLAEEPLPPFDEDGNLLWRVGQKVQMRRGWRWPKPFVGEIVNVRSGTHNLGEYMIGYDVREPDGESFWQRTADIIGLAE